MNLPLRPTYTDGVASKLRVKGLSRTVRSKDGELRVVDAVDLELDPGQALGVTGPLDSGWRSLLRLIVGLDPVTAGTVELVDRPPGPRGNPEGKEELRQEVVLASALDPLLDTNLDETARAIGRLGASRRRRVPPVSGRTLRSAAGIAATSGPLTPCERLRLQVALGAAMLPAHILVEVEPPLGSAEDRRAVAEILGRLLGGGIGVLIGTRDELLLAEVAAHVLIFEDGAVLAEGSPESVLTAAWQRVRARGPS